MKKVWAWLFYDAANSAYGTIMVSAYFVLFFKSHIVSDPHRGDFLWGAALSTSMAILALVTPFLGAYGDVKGIRHQFLRGFTLLSVLATLALTFSKPGGIAFAFVVFVASNIGYEGGIVFYDSFLSYVSNPTTRGRVSGYGYAFGYAGGILALLFSIPFLKQRDAWSTWPIALAALQFFLISIPAFLYLKDPNPRNDTLQFKDSIRRTWTELCASFRLLSHFPEARRLLLAYFIFNDGMVTVISFSGAFAHDTYGLPPLEIFYLFLLANLTAILGALLGGALADRYGAKKTILGTLLLWGAILIAMSLIHSRGLFYFLSALVGVGLGATQVPTRSLYASLVPQGFEGRFFSLKGICGKLSSILGPMVFGTISYVTQSQRWAILSILLFFVMGFFTLLPLNEKRGMERSMAK